jgi:hypothetical protein
LLSRVRSNKEVPHLSAPGWPDEFADSINKQKRPIVKFLTWLSNLYNQSWHNRTFPTMKCCVDHNLTGWRWVSVPICIDIMVGLDEVLQNDRS